MPVSAALASNWSLARRQQTILVSSLTAVALLLGIGGAWYIRDFAERASDRVLRASANAVSETVALERGQVTLEVPSGAFGMLEDSERDNVFYAVNSGGKVITGYEDFPQPLAIPGPDETLYRYDDYHGQPVRVATQARYLIDGYPPVLVQVAETLDERHAMFRRMLLGLVGLEIALIAIAALLIGPAIRWGLAPLTFLRDAIDTRRVSSTAFQPLDAKQAPQELRGLIETFNSLLDRLDRATRRVREFTGDASHQMRTPLAALRAQLHLATQQSVSERDRLTAVAEADAAAERLQRLITQLIALAKSDSLAPGTVKVVELGSVVADIARELAPEAVARGCEVHFDAEPALWAQVDAFVLEEMLANLIDNALLYGRPGGSINLRLRGEGTSALIEVEDDGPGIPASERTAVLQRFYRLSRDDDTHGSGLGLAIVQSLSDFAGGKLELGEGEAGGLLVRLYFPMVRSPQAD